MSLARLIYRSTANNKATSNKGLKALEQQASNNNASHEITGLLILSGDTFVQVLEGEPAVLTALFGHIVSDQRHSHVELISFQTIEQRSFDQWAMRLIDLYDIPGDRRALLAKKYDMENENIKIPTDLYQLYALLFDANELCLSTPWNDTDN